jgi:RND superfamily putative drug exporter
MADRFARVVVVARVPIVVGWIVLAVALTALLPSIREAQVGALGDLVPAGAEAIDTEQRAAELFAFPFLSRTIVVTRQDDGLALADQARVALQTAQLNRGALPVLRETRGYLIPNAVGAVPLVRERSTTLLNPLLFGPGVGQGGRVGAAERFAERHVRPTVGPEPYVGVTGAIAARAAQSDVIKDHLPLFEIATLIFVLVAVGVYLRALVAPVVNLAAVAIAYLVSVRLVATIGRELGVSVPSEVEPVIVALLFGVVTDYSLFFLSRVRRRLESGEQPQAAVRAATAELTPIILACGMAVAAACTALLVADLGFLQAFGPGMALAVLIGMAVAMTFVPAALALLGPLLFWPSRPVPHAGEARAADRFSGRLVRRAVTYPRRTIVLCLLVLAAMTAPLAEIELGNPLIRGLPADSQPRVAYAQASQGFVPGVLSPTVLLVEQPGVTRERAALQRLQRRLAEHPGVAAVLGPAANPTGLELGAVLARNGAAARYVIVFEADPLGSTAIRRLDDLRERIDDELARAGLPLAQASFAGDTALSQETIEDTVDNLWRVVPAVLIAVLLVLVVFLRGLVAPLYLVAVATLAPLAAAGLGVILFELLLDGEELVYYVPVTAGVLLVALGSDYNILLVGRVWSEARSHPLEEATVLAGAGAARAISAAAIVLAFSFGAMALVPIDAFQQLGFIMATGLLIDAFLVRTVLVPAIISLVGYRSGWPGRRLQLEPERPRPAVSGPPPAPAPASITASRPVPRTPAARAAGRVRRPLRPTIVAPVALAIAAIAIVTLRALRSARRA